MEGVQDETCDYIAKMILLGDASVGKSNLLMRWTRGEFDLETKSTVGVEFATKSVTIGGKRLTVQVWDTAGQERFRSIAKAFYNGALGAIIVYDITNRDSFQSTQRWIDDCHTFASEGIKIILVGNKSDLQHLREVSTTEGRIFSEKHGLSFMETSALKDTGVNEAFMALMKEVYESGVSPERNPDHPWNKSLDKQNFMDVIVLDPEEPPRDEQNSFWCCK
eukprot:TRINITY_DN9446_c0_g1_i2.p1 TRINITY_DN9446_c0_g1~~TRINITY_DN9446_c0_g1_i2.p1  ORF type:complete len:221 (+),score=40.78 TRINITY_DN9446_c0_g1_i2:73-735(+)